MACDFNPRWIWTKTDITNVLKLIKDCESPIVHVCSGCSAIGDYRLDRSYIDPIILNKQACKIYRAPCNIFGDYHNLPFKDGIANTVLCDPPYRYDFTSDTMINELIRILKPKGTLLFIAPWVPKSKLITLKSTDYWKTGNRPYYKIASMFYKSNGQLSDYF